MIDPLNLHINGVSGAAAYAVFFGFASLLVLMGWGLRKLWFAVKDPDAACATEQEIRPWIRKLLFAVMVLFVIGGVASGIYLPKWPSVMIYLGAIPLIIAYRLERSPTTSPRRKVAAESLLNIACAFFLAYFVINIAL